MCFRKKIFLSHNRIHFTRTRTNANNFYSSHSFRVIFASFEVVFDLQSSFADCFSKTKTIKVSNKEKYIPTKEC